MASGRCSGTRTLRGQFQLRSRAQEVCHPHKEVWNDFESYRPIQVLGVGGASPGGFLFG